MAEVVLEQLNKIFDPDVHVVKDINLHIRDEEFMVLVGPSGCGKSTTLRMIAGLEDISSGKIKIGDREVNTVAPKNRDIAMVFQNYALYPHMTVFDNMAFGLKLRKFTQQEITQRVHEAAEILDLTEYLDRRPKALSGGQRQRVAVGRAIVRKPKVFLFDEPLSNLDAKLRVQMRIEISKLHQKLATTMIYVTHDQVEAMTMGDRITVLKDGIIQQVDTPLNLYNQPKNKFVASFIGSPSMNFFEGRLVTADAVHFESAIGSVTLAQNAADQLHINQNSAVTLGVRPEHINIAGSADESEQHIVARVDVIEPMGNELFVYLSHDNQTFIMRSDAHTSISVGDTVNLRFDLNKIHFFDSQTSENCSRILDS